MIEVGACVNQCKPTGTFGLCEGQMNRRYENTNHDQINKTELFTHGIYKHTQHGQNHPLNQRCQIIFVNILVKHNFCTRDDRFRTRGVTFRFRIQRFVFFYKVIEQCFTVILTEGAYINQPISVAGADQSPVPNSGSYVFPKRFYKRNNQTIILDY